MAFSLNPALMDDRDVFFKILWDSIGNVLWYGAATAVIAVIGKIFWWAGVVLFGLFVIILIVSFLQTLIVTILGIVSTTLAIYEKLKDRSLHAREQLYLGAANIIQLVELTIFAGYMVGLYKVFF